MIGLALAFVTSLLLGMRHATDADHIVAVSTIVGTERSLARASRVGVVWGIGHTLTILVVGTTIIVFKMTFTPALGVSLEMAVAAMLIVLGALNLTGVGSMSPASSNARPFIVGVVHGLAGSAGATLLVLPLIDDVRWAAAYLIVFGLGTIAGMGLVTVSIAASAMLASKRIAGLQRSLRLASGGVSLAFGVYLFVALS